MHTARCDIALSTTNRLLCFPAIRQEKVKARDQFRMERP